MNQQHAPGPGSTADLASWERFMEQRHPRAMDLGLSRVAAVAQRLGLPAESSKIILVGGTNGKGSTTLMIEALLEAAGMTSAATLSPHLHRYNERFRIRGKEAADQEIVGALDRVDQAAARTPEISLTYFEYSFVAFLQLAADHAVDVLVVEVGLGGRLDAANILDADVAVITAVALDHQQWLGDTREEIAAEKAAIGRVDRPLVFGESDVPAAIRKRGEEGVHLRLSGADFDWHLQDQRFVWRSQMVRGSKAAQSQSLSCDLVAGLHPANLSTALAALTELGVPVDRAVLETALGGLYLPGRCERLPGALPLLVDVAHNPHAAQWLARYLARHYPDHRITLLLGCLADKDIEGIAECLLPAVDEVVACTVEGARGLTASALAERLGETGPRCPVGESDGVAQALQGLVLSQSATAGQLFVVAGCFAAAEAARLWHAEQNQEAVA